MVWHVGNNQEEKADDRSSIGYNLFMKVVFLLSSHEIKINKFVWCSDDVVSEAVRQIRRHQAHFVNSEMKYH